jgi:uncharacterized membrane-anchored protein
MKKIFVLLPLLLMMCSSSNAQKKDSAETAELETRKKYIAREKEIKYQTGKIDIGSDIELNVPKGYKYIGLKDAEYIVNELWSNPPDATMRGMLVAEDYNSLSTDKWAFIVSYEDEGYVKDEDADKIDYTEMKKEIQADEKESNEARKKQGYAAMHFIDWASKPYYDKQEKILHWAKNFKFGDQEDTTLNYDVRILGRKGLISLNAVGISTDLEDIKKHIPEIMHVATFKQGSRYADFDSKTDKIAAYTIGGLVAGKLLAKAGIAALFLKNIKLFFLGIAALFGTTRKKIAAWFTGKKSED